MISDIASTASSPSTDLSGVINPGSKMGKDEFLKMLVAQLKNQDPMSPMKGDDMAAQLAQFSSLEQLTKMGAAMEAQAAAQQGLIGSIHDTTAMNVLGKTVLAAGNEVEVGGTGAEEVQFEVGGSGGLATLKILDDNGKQIGSRPLGFLTAGKHEFELGSASAGLAPGAYRFAIDVADAAGKPVLTQTYISAKIDGVRYGSEGPILTSGGLKIPFGTVLQITAD